MKDGFRTLTITLTVVSIIITFIACFSLLSFQPYGNNLNTPNTSKTINDTSLNLSFEEVNLGYSVSVLDPTKTSQIFIPSVYNSKSVTSIAESGFRYSKAYNISIPDGITEIGDMAFWDCENITNITIPKTITNFSNTWFLNCKRLSSVDVSSSHPTLSSVEGVLFNKSKTWIYIYPQAKHETSYIIPDSVTLIASSCFKGASNLIAIDIPESVIDIGSDAFNRTSITEIKLHKTLSSLGFTIFPETLNTIYYEGSQEEWGSIYLNGSVYYRYFNQTTQTFARIVPTIIYNYDFVE